MRLDMITRGNVLSPVVGGVMRALRTTPTAGGEESVVLVFYGVSPNQRFDGREFAMWLHRTEAIKLIRDIQTVLDGQTPQPEPESEVEEDEIQVRAKSIDEDDDYSESEFTKAAAAVRPQLPRLTAKRRQQIEDLAKAIVVTCMRNTILEDYHAGTWPSSKTGDYSDVKVVSPYGEIPWNNVSRISDEEMKALMIDVVNNVYTYLRCQDADIPLILTRAPPDWYRAKLVESMIFTGAMLEAGMKASLKLEDSKLEDSRVDTGC